MRNQPARPGKRSLGRRILFFTLMLLLTAIVTLVAGEALVRLVVPEETYWSVNNIYQISGIPGVFYTYKPNYNRISFGVDLKTNSPGFRGPEWSKQKSPGIYRIALIGDSHAFGFGVRYEDTVGEMLAKILKERYGRPVEVLNFGVNGYNSMQEQAVLEHFALGYDPDMVILIPSSNDHEPPLKVDPTGWRHWDSDPSNTKSRMKDQFVEDIKNGIHARWVENSRLLFYLKLVHKRRQYRAEAQAKWNYSPGGIPDSHWMKPVYPGPVSSHLAETVYQPLVAMLTEINARDIPVIVAPFAANPDYRRMFQVLKRDYDIPLVELLALFPEVRNWKELTEKFSLGWDKHLNAVAHRRFAEGIAEAIKARGYLLPDHLTRAGQLR